MKLKNSTAIPNTIVRDVIRFVCPSGVTGYDVRVGTNSGGLFKGTAYHKGSSYHATAAPFVNLFIGSAKRFPSLPRPSYKAGYLPIPWLADQTEALVFVAAHELRHLWQARRKTGGRVWGSRGQFSERDADAYAIRMLRAWRARKEPNGA